jgi:TolB-like protein
MLAGRLPFRGEMDAAMVYSILNEEPAPVTAARKEVPVALEDVVERALSKDTAKRYQTIDEMVAELERVAEESRLGIERKHYAALKRLKRRKRLLTGTGAVLVIAIAAVLVTTFYRSGQALDSIAVLPFENLSGVDSLDVYADGATGELIANFRKIGAMKKVIHRSASMRYKDTDKTLKQIADELEVKALVLGVVQVEGDNIKITPELIKGDTEELLWSDTFDGKTRDVLSLQGQIARSLANEINVILTPEEKDLLTIERPVDPEAYEAYVLGMNYSEILTPEGIQTAMKWLNRAVEIDSTYAQPYAAMAILQAHVYRDFDEAEALALKAEEIDPRLPEIHIARAAVLLTRDWDWEGAMREVAMAEQLASVPCNVHGIDLFYMLSGQMDRAIECGLNDITSDPMNPQPATMLAWLYRCASRPEDAIELGRKVLERFPDDEEWVTETWKEMGLAYTMMGQTDSSFAIAERLGVEVTNQVYAAAGMREPIRKDLEDKLKLWEETDGKHSRLAYEIGATYGCLGENDKAFEWLEKAYEMREFLMMYLNPGVGAGEFDNLLEDPRMADLMRRVGIPRTVIPERLASMKKYGLL